MIRWTKKLTIGSLCAAAVLTGTVAYGLTTATAATGGGTQPTAAISTAAPSTSQTNSFKEQLKQLRQTNQQLNQEIRSAVQQWKGLHNNKEAKQGLKATISPLRNQLKDVTSKLKSLRATVKSDIQAKDKSKAQADMQQAIPLLNQEISLKQQILAALQSPN